MTYSRVRLGIFLVGSAATFVAYGSLAGVMTWASAVVSVTLFVLAARRHERVILSLKRHRVYRSIKLAHIARMDRDWPAMPPAAAQSVPAGHAFAADLNLLGTRSLHHLMDTSFSKGGSSRLADWLCAEFPELVATRRRQLLVRQMVSLAPLRDRLSLLSAVVAGKAGDRFDGEVLMAWLGRHADKGRVLPVLRVLSGLAALTWVLVLFHIAGVLGPWWALSLVTYVGVYLFNGALYSHLFDEAEHLHYQLERFRPVVLTLERFRFRSGSSVESLVEPFRGVETKPSKHLREMMWLTVAASAQKNEILRVVLNLAVPWDLFFAYRLSLYKARLTRLLPEWLSVIYELEAAGSLATFADLNPESTFPELLDPIDATGVAVLKIRGLGHPLLASTGKVRNDYELKKPGDLTIITGSNMSGKSTFLRAVGLAQVMAMAGSSVDAETLKLVPMRTFSCMTVHDSVTDGMSFFYAEVKRLAAMMGALREGGSLPILVLIDEIFRGTNNRERLLGSRALLLEMARRRVLGIVATHDLELVALSDEVEGIENMHFREEVLGGRMVFDYTLREGPCPTTNALKIMAAEGLPTCLDT